MTFSFPKGERLLSKRQFSCVIQKGQRCCSGLLLFSFLPRSNGPSRLGITVPKKYGIAVKRNLFKRRVREAFRLHIKKLGNFDICVKPVISKDPPPSLDQICQEMEKAYNKTLNDSLDLAGVAGGCNPGSEQ